MYKLKIYTVHICGFQGTQTPSRMLGEYERNPVDHELEASDLQAF